MACEQHYVDAAKLYDSQVFYDKEGPLVQWQLDQVCSKLSLGSSDRLVDIGGGTGIFTLELLRRTGCSAVLVEPSADMLKEAEDREGGKDIRCVCASVQTFLTSCEGASEKYDRLLLKEVAHHIPEEERATTFAGLLSLLEPGGKLVILTRPNNPEYPFFEKSRAIWQTQVPETFVASLEDGLRVAGFEVETFREAFPMAMPKSVWYDMVRQRFWSCFAPLTDEELEAGILEVEEQNTGKDHLTFNEVELFIVATKPTIG